MTAFDREAAQRVADETLASYEHRHSRALAGYLAAALAELDRAEAERDDARERFRELHAMATGGHTVVDVALAAERARADRAEEKLRDDAAGRPFASLLREAADVLTGRGDGPLADCLRQKAEDVDAALAGSSRVPPADTGPNA